MVCTRIRRSLSNDDGAATPLILAIILFVLLGFAVLYQYLFASAILDTVHESCSFVTERALITNAESSYQAKRDGYTGVWHLDGREISDPTVSIDPRISLAQQLNLDRQGNDLVKTDGVDEIYRLRNIELTIENPDFQEDSILLIATISLDADIILHFPMVGEHTVSIPLQVSAAWNPKF